MDLRCKVSGHIAKPISEVFEAVVDPGQLSAFFTTGGAKGRLETGAVVTWDFADFPGAFPVEVVRVEKDSLIVLRWGAADGDYQTEVTMTFTAIEPARTLVTITETGWRETDAAIAACIGNSGGWMHALCCMKVWLEHGMRLRDGFFV